MVELLVVEFDQAKHEKFLSSSSKIPKVVRQYGRVPQRPALKSLRRLLEECPPVNITISGRIARVAQVNVSHETREANDDEGQSRYISPLQIP